MFQKLEGNGARVINLYRMMGHSSAALEPFLKLGNRLLTKAKLEARLRELAILRIANLAGSEYEWQQHAGLAREVGVTESQMTDLPNWQESGAFDDRDKAVLTYVDEVAIRVNVADDTFARLTDYLDETEIVELTLSLGFWGMVARFLVPLRVDLEKGTEVGGQELLGGSKRG